MHRFPLFAVALAFIAPDVDAATIWLTDINGNTDITATGPTTDVYVRLIEDGNDSGIRDLAGYNLNFAVGDGGPLPGPGSDIVPITGYTFTNAATGADAPIWNTSPIFSAPAVTPFPASSTQGQGVLLSTPNANVQYSAIGTSLGDASVIGIVTLDTSSLLAGSGDSLGTTNTAGDPAFLLTMSPDFAASTASRNTGSGGTAPLNLTLQNSTLSAVPEPGSYVLLALGTAAFVHRRRKRQVSTANAA